MIPAGRADDPPAVAVSAGPSAEIPEWSPAQRAFFWASFVGGLGWCAFVALASPGWSLDDELSHYLRSLSVWSHPPLIFDAWTRIGRNLFHVLPAPLGLDATRLWTLAFAALAIPITVDLARRLGARHTWLVPLLLIFQPWFVELSWGVLTQTPFLLALVAGVWALVAGRLTLSGLCFGLLPLIRHEGLALTALWPVLLLGHVLSGGAPIGPARWVPPMLALAFPLAAYNVGAWLVLGELPLRVFFAPKPTEIYGSGPLWHFLAVSWQPAGIATLALAAFGLLPALGRWRATWPLLVYPAYFALHGLIFWRGLFASGGYYHFVMPLAPGLAILAVFGADWLLARRWKVIAAVLLAASLLQGVVLFHLWRDGRWLVTLQRDPVTVALDEALAWQQRERPGAVTKCQHVYVMWREVWIETPARRALFTTAPADLPPGAVVIWEAKYADVTGAPLPALRGDAAFVERATFGGGSVRVFEKLR